MLTRAPPSGAQVAADPAFSAVVAAATLGVLLLSAGMLTRWMLERRRLAAWDVAWAAVGPRWASGR